MQHTRFWNSSNILASTSISPFHHNLPSVTLIKAQYHFPLVFWKTLNQHERQCVFQGLIELACVYNSNELWKSGKIFVSNFVTVPCVENETFDIILEMWTLG